MVINPPQYQQNEESPLISTKLTNHKKDPTTYDVEKPCPGLGLAQNSGGVKPFNGITALNMFFFLGT